MTALPRRCAHLATKSDYYRDPREPAPWDAGSGSTAIYWCVLTSKSIGPDGAPCDVAACAAGRGCHVPSRHPHHVLPGDEGRQGDAGL